MRSIVRALGISDGNMEQGSLRCDANISVRPVGSDGLGTKAEIKNINSFRFVQKALEYEIERQIEAVGRGESIVQETRLWDSERNVTESMRTKEEAHDYRYFPDPDLPPVEVSEQLIERLRADLPELPVTRRLRFVEQHGLSDQDAAEMTRERALSDYFEATVKAGADPKRAANWIMTELLSKLADPRDAVDAPVSPQGVAELLGLVQSDKISLKLAKQIWPKMWDTGKSAEQIATEDDLFQQSDVGAIEKDVVALVKANPDKVAQYREGKTKMFGWFVGQIMRATQGKANPAMVNELLKKHLERGE